MTTTAMNPNTLSAGWSALSEMRGAGEPAWAREQRKRALATAERLQYPDRGLELWRRTDFGSLKLDAMDVAAAGAVVSEFAGLPDTVRARLGGASDHPAVVVQRNNTVAYVEVDPALAKRGLVVCSMERALREHGARLESRLNALVETDHDRFTALNQALRSGGAFVYVPEGVELEQPIRLVQWLEGGGVATAPASVVVVERGARATVIEELLSDTADAPAFYNGATEVFVGADAKLVYATLQHWGRHVYHYSNQRAQVARNGELQWIQTLLGARMEKTNSYFRMVEPGAQVYVHGFMFGDARQHFDMHTLQKHLADHCTSDLLIKSCLKDRARSVYQGLIQVAEGAQRTDAYQANRNLLLSETARADSIPGLEILANDVRCTHGATIGNVDAEQMYYLMARGLRPHEAQRLIVEGFFAPVIDRIPLEAVREQLREVIQTKIGIAP
jgi:Fe-S cluster assembly protein SufD